MSDGRWKQKLIKFRALRSADQWMLLHATVWLALARLALLALPFRRLAAKLASKRDCPDACSDPLLLERVSSSIRAASANVPWRSDCFPQSIAGWMLLKHYGYASTIHLGVQKVGENEVAGHAWLTCGGTVITGGEGLDRYAEIHRLGA